MKRCGSPPVSGWVSRSSRRYARRRSSSEAEAGTPSTSYGEADIGLSGMALTSSDQAGFGDTPYRALSMSGVSPERA